MNQKKIGEFIKELRKEKKLTQEEFAEIIGVTNRSVSRWENGVNMPDFDLLIQIAGYFEVDIEEVLDGERKQPASKAGQENSNRAPEDIQAKENPEKSEETLLKVAEYNTGENMIFLRRMNLIFAVSLVAFIIYMLIDINDLESTGVYEYIADFMLGIVFGVLISGTLYTSRYASKVRAFKRRLLGRLKKLGN